MPQTPLPVVIAESPSPPAWFRTFTATPDQVGKARRFLACLLDGSPLAGDALTCLSELATNAICHSNSRLPGGTFTVRVHLHGHSFRVDVEDQGGRWAPARHNGEQNGRGLLIVSQLATTWDISGDGTTRTVSFEMTRP